MATGNPKAESRKPKATGVVVLQPLKWHQRLVAALIYALIRCVAATLRFKFNDLAGAFSTPPPEKFIFAIWHNRLFLSLVVYHRYVSRGNRARRLVAMVSASRDGGLAARVLEHFRVQPVRGSSSRRGAQALREMVTWGRRGLDLSITPDGPRGPRYVVQEGVMATAQMTSLAIVPVAYHLQWKICAKSWDRFQIPLPFSRCEVTFGPAFRVPPETDEAGREVLRQKLETELRAITRD